MGSQRLGEALGTRCAEPKTGALPIECGRHDYSPVKTGGGIEYRSRRQFSCKENPLSHSLPPKKGSLVEMVGVEPTLHKGRWVTATLMSTHHISKFWHAWRDSNPHLTCGATSAVETGRSKSTKLQAHGGKRSSIACRIEPNPFGVMASQVMCATQLSVPDRFTFQQNTAIYRLVVTPTGTYPDNKSNLRLIYSGALLSNAIAASHFV